MWSKQGTGSGLEMGFKIMVFCFPFAQRKILCAGEHTELLLLVLPFHALHKGSPGWNVLYSFPEHTADPEAICPVLVFHHQISY